MVNHIPPPVLTRWAASSPGLAPAASSSPALSPSSPVLSLPLPALSPPLPALSPPPSDPASPLPPARRARRPRAPPGTPVKSPNTYSPPDGSVIVTRIYDELAKRDLEFEQMLAKYEEERWDTPDTSHLQYWEVNPFYNQIEEPEVKDEDKNGGFTLIVISSDEDERGETPETDEGSDEEGDTDSFHSAMSTCRPPPA